MNYWLLFVWMKSLQSGNCTVKWRKHLYENTKSSNKTLFKNQRQNVIVDSYCLRNRFISPWINSDTFPRT